MDNSGIDIGHTTKTGFTLKTKITDLNQFWNAINIEKSIYARHRMYPTAFFMSWNIRLIKNWIDKGWFFIAHKNNKK